MYNEIKRRTKCLYGVHDIKRMIEKSKDSSTYLSKDPCFINTEIDPETEAANQ